MGKKPATDAPLAPRVGAPCDSQPQKVLPFYSDREGKRFREFSNFYRHGRPYEFRLPAFARQEGFPATVWCEFSEKAVMAVKAALMGDLEVFREIEAASHPASCKKLGRGVRGFDEELWQKHLEEVAFEVVLQKFDSEKSLRELLLSTGDRVLAEAAPNDCIWGIGLPTSGPRCHDPSQWRGRNVLGYALMRARERLRLRARGAGGDAEEEGAAAAPGKGAGRPGHLKWQQRQTPAGRAAACVQPAEMDEPAAAGGSRHGEELQREAEAGADAGADGRQLRWGRRAPRAERAGGHASPAMGAADE